MMAVAVLSQSLNLCLIVSLIMFSQVCRSAGGYSKGVGKAGNDGRANDVQRLAWGGIRGTKGLKLISKVTSHALNLVFPVEVHGEDHSKG